MASIKCYTHIDTFDSKKPNSVLHFSDRCFILAFHTVSNTVCSNSFGKLKQARVSRVDTELSDVLQSNNVGRPVDVSQENVVVQNPRLHKKFKKAKRSIWKRLDGMRNVANDLNGNSKQHEVRVETDDLLLGNDDEFYEKLSANGSESSLGDCNSVLEKLESGARDDEVLKFFEWMRVNGKLKRNVSGYKLALRVLGRRQDWEGAERLIREMETESSCELSFQIFNTLIYACHKRGLVGPGTKWFRMMLDAGIQPNVATFGMVMSLYQKGGNLDEAEFAFSQMRRFRIVCHSAYSAMITLYTRLGLYEKSEKIVAFLKNDKVILNQENWLVLVNSYSQQGKLDEAENVLASMHAAGFSPHIVAYNTLITGYGKISNMKDAERVFQNLVSAGLKPDESTYRTMIEGWGRVHNFKEAEWYYNEMNKLDFKPNSSNLYTMINLQAKHGDEAGAMRIIEDMITIGCQFSAILSIVLQAYEKAEQFDKVPYVIKGLLYDHVLNNQTSCSILVMAYVKHGLVDDAIEVLGLKKWKDKVFEDSLYHLLICTCKELGHLSNSIKIYASMPKRDKANLHITCIGDVLTELKESGLKPDLCSYNSLIKAYGIAGMVEDAVNLVKEMRKNGIEPDRITYTNLIAAFQKNDMVLEALKWSLWMKQMGM
ncbi:putative tetratricopeptide-like helical domain superfamily [Helianthus annuus]|nr:putative tetratricopeptide-like helical domain superfamily [Helianthus annuus]KAJ0766924.1 putative tetratricopeptide-like helical domain superfamily [Helianthus annuus]